ncbi:MAG: polyprenol monophosphomannose synthase [Anaerolineae bacterium]
MEISIVLPTFNESDNIIPLVERTLAALADYAMEVVVVDDDSPDGTWRLVADKAARDSRVRLIRRTTERGLTSAIWRGIVEARGEWVGWMDCDLSMPPEAWPRLADALRDGADIAVGSRYVPGGADVAHSPTGRAFSRVINLAAGLLLDWRIKDYTSGFILARRAVFQAITLRGDYGEYCIDLLYRAVKGGFRVEEVPYICVPREAGESKTAANAWGYVTRGVNYVKTLAHLRFNYQVSSIN